MRRMIMLFAVAMLLLSLGGCPPTAAPYEEIPTLVRVETSQGEFVIRLFEDEAPTTTANFLAYVEDDFYDGTIVHSAIPVYAVQFGGYLPGLVAKATRPPIASEARNGLINARGTVGLARDEGDPNSGTSQFYINVATNPGLDPSLTSQGYAVFGYVVEGMDVVDTISEVDTTVVGAFTSVPEADITIISATVEEGEPELSSDWQSWVDGVVTNAESVGRSFLQDVLTYWLF